jgi:branched-chain amino acid transport system ATP-binding protein
VVPATEGSSAATTGEALGVVGPNGAGKTTLLGLIAGEIRPDSGTVHFDGREVTQLGAAQRCRAGMARTFQIPRPFADMSVFENVLVGASSGSGLLGQAAYARAVESLEVTGLTDVANRPAGALSLLERKRLELARALATRPRLVLLDEIAGGLTERELPALVQTVRGLRDAGCAVIWIEHIVHALLAMVDRLMCLAFGRILALGNPHEVMRSAEVIEVYVGSTVDLREGP